MNYIDFHCDTLMHGYFQGLHDIYDMEGSMVNIKKLREGNCEAQFFAVFFPPRGNSHPHAPYPGDFPSDLEYFTGMRQLLLDTIEKHPDELAFAGNASELQNAKEQGKTAAFLTLEDGRAIDGSLEQLEDFYQKGVRLITLIWNHPNCLGFPNSRDPQSMSLGLTDFGKQAVERMNELGILVDVSHLSDGGFYDVAQISRKPFLASHSNARALSPHPRNLTDEMLHILGQKQGVTGLNFLGGFLSEDTDSKESKISDMVCHAAHIVDKAGEDALSIGTDFDGFDGELEIPTPVQMPLLFEALQKEGFTPRQIDKFAYGNAERLIAEIGN